MWDLRIWQRGGKELARERAGDENGCVATACREKDKPDKDCCARKHAGKSTGSCDYGYIFETGEPCWGGKGLMTCCKSMETLHHHVVHKLSKIWGANQAILGMPSLPQEDGHGH